MNGQTVKGIRRSQKNKTLFLVQNRRDLQTVIITDKIHKKLAVVENV